ncbi:MULTISPECIES: c-type cytochrome biogenesis protein CcmI [unclassified Roseovarius]|uniref:c-type cytochrome biogenesis protein CcmI n=1 Tax=unclassified Roseovarius TaxID=2614913 RepID=UPI00273F006D|nr:MULTISPECIES: c-type cytochrome biogenesis protein CcmI [unclassified Roseovarius]
MIWIVLVFLALATAVALAVGFRRDPEALPRRDGAIAILRDQLREIEADRDRGLINDDEATAAEVEVKRRILSVSRSEGQVVAHNSGRWVIAVAALLVPLTAGMLYLQIGAPSIESQPFAERKAEQEQATQIADLTARLKNRLESDVSGGPTEGWVLLGQTYMRMRRYAEAVDAFARVIARDDADASVLSRYADALIAAENGIVTPQAERVIDQVMARDPANPAATFYKAQAMEQGGELTSARALLLEMLETADSFYPWMEIFVASVNRLGDQTGEPPVSLTAFAPIPGGERGPSAADVAAAEDMPEEDREAFIRSMVDGLAARLEEDSNDLDGWFRLIRAYAVLGEVEAAVAAREKALAVVNALPENDPRRAAALTQLEAEMN